MRTVIYVCLIGVKRNLNKVMHGHSLGTHRYLISGDSVELYSLSTESTQRKNEKVKGGGRSM